MDRWKTARRYSRVSLVAFGAVLAGLIGARLLGLGTGLTQRSFLITVSLAILVETGLDLWSGTYRARWGRLIHRKDRPVLFAWNMLLQALLAAFTLVFGFRS